MAALLGAYASSLMSSGGYQLNDAQISGNFTVKAHSILIYGGPPSLIMQIANATANATGYRKPIAFANQTKLTIINMSLTKEEDGKILEIWADRATATRLYMNMTYLKADSAEFNNLTIVDIPAFKQSARNNVNFTGNVEIHAVYMFAELQNLYGMKINVKESC